jgi:hypothetical protein
MTLEEAWKLKRLLPPFFARFTSHKEKDIKITKVILTEEFIFIFDEKDQNLTCHHLEVIEICGSFISPFCRTRITI